MKSSEQNLNNLLQEGIRHHQAGELAKAEAIYQRILARMPHHLEARHMLGVVALQRGRKEEAARLIGQVVAAKPDHGQAQNNLGNVMVELGRFPEAERCFRQAVAVNPRSPEGYNNLGNVLRETGRFAEALAVYQQALQVRADYFQVWNNMGIALKELGRLAEAEQAFQRALSFHGGYVEALTNLATLRQEQGKLAEAKGLLQKALQLRPDFSPAVSAMAQLLVDKDTRMEAMALHRKAMELEPKAAHHRNNLANLLAEEGRFAEAEALFRQAVELDPGMHQAWTNLGNLMGQQLRMTEALACYEKALTVKASYPEAIFGRALVLLTLGRLEEGWPGYELRWGGSYLDIRGKPASRLPQWRGESLPLASGVVVYGEQGMGDSLHFARYLPLLAARFAKVRCVVPTPLLRLFQESFGDLLEVTDKPQEEGFQAHLPMMSFPLAFRTSMQTLPSGVPYLQAMEERRLVWRQRLAPMEGLKVGLCWSGRSELPADSRRSLTLQQCQPLWQLAGVHWFSLNKTLRPGEVVPPVVTDWMGEMSDFADTAAFLSELDLIITVDTAVAHLAGGLARPVWLLNRHDTEWRWLLEREDSPWYPTMKLFRQPKAGDWQTVVGRVVEGLREKVPQRVETALDERVLVVHQANPAELGQGMAMIRRLLSVNAQLEVVSWNQVEQAVGPWDVVILGVGEVWKEEWFSPALTAILERNIPTLALFRWSERVGAGRVGEMMRCLTAWVYAEECHSRWLGKRGRRMGDWLALSRPLAVQDETLAAQRQQTAAQWQQLADEVASWRKG
ncbi:MAG: tetratricopeptide repeat protein [Magnetococcales bacterium]|nr:tetratricopeptide repeat protein [Magnetococcales bacterium]